MKRAGRDATRVVRSWLEEGVDRIPDRVLDAVESRLAATPQRRAGWLGRLLAGRHVDGLRLSVAAVVLALAAIFGMTLLPGTVGGPSDEPAPTPEPLASGRFDAAFGSTEIEATGSGADVEGAMKVATDSGAFTVDLQCSATTDDGLIVIGGGVTETTHDGVPRGRRVAIVLQPRTPIGAVLWFEDHRPAPSCSRFLNSVPPNAADSLMPIQGSLDLGP